MLVLGTAYGAAAASVACGAAMLCVPTSAQLSLLMFAAAAAPAALMRFCQRSAVCAAASDNLRQKVWMSSTGGGGAAPYKLVVQEDGNAVIFDGSGTSLWTTHTADAVVP